MSHPTDQDNRLSLQPSPLAALHEEAGAKVAEFAGWAMPISFAGTIAEHTAVREGAGIFDVSHLGTVWVTGEDAFETVDRAFTNDPRPLEDGGSQYTLCATPDGGVVDDLIVYRVNVDRWMVIPNAANTPAVVQRLQEVSSEAVVVADESTLWTILAVQGPRALALVESCFGVDATALSFGQHTRVEIDDSPVMMCRTGYTGEPGVELVAPIEAGAAIWDAAVAAGAERCGLAARDTLRLEMGYPLHGNELGPDISPYEARSGWAVKLADRDFVGRDALAAAKEAGAARRLWGLVGDGRRPPRAGMAVALGDRQVGKVTSGSFSPTLGVGIGLALLDADVSDGTTVSVDVRGTDVPFVVTKPPMVDRDPH